DVTSAVAVHDFAQLFLLLRRYAGTSQTKIGTAVGLSQGAVSQIMSGRKRPTYHEVISRIATGLAMPDHARVLLGVAPLNPPPPGPQALTPPDTPSALRTVLPGPADSTTTAGQTPYGSESAVSRRTVAIETYPIPASATYWADDATSEGDQDMQRRHLLQGLATLGMAGSLGSTEQLRRDLLAVIGGERIDISEWEQIAWEYSCTYATPPPARLLDDLTQDLLVAHRQLALAGDSPTRRPLQRVVAQLAVFLAQTMGNLGNLRASRRWWRSARYAADASTDPQVRVWVRGLEVIRALYVNPPLHDALPLPADTAAITPT